MAYYASVIQVKSLVRLIFFFFFFYAAHVQSKNAQSVDKRSVTALD